MSPNYLKWYMLRRAYNGQRVGRWTKWAGTLVLTGCGPFPIETIQTGDTVLAYDFTTQNWLPAFVEKPLVHDYDGLIYTIAVAGEKIEVTAGHPFWVADGCELSLRPESGHIYENERGLTYAGRWVDSQDLRPGDTLLLTTGQTAPISAISARPAKIKVYNLTVAQYHNYAVTASGVLVHNKALHSPYQNPNITTKIGGVTVEDKFTGKTLTGTVDLSPTIKRIETGGSYPHRNDGSIFKNKDQLLPNNALDYYREYVHPTPGFNGPGPQRIVIGRQGEMFYSPDHYETFIPLNP